MTCRWSWEGPARRPHPKAQLAARLRGARLPRRAARRPQKSRMRSSRSTVPARCHTGSSRLCDEDAARMERRHRRTPPDGLPVGRIAELDPAARLRGLHVEKDKPTGFSGVPPPGPAMPVTEMATSAPSRRASASCHRRRRLRGDSAVSPQQLSGTPSAGLLHVVRIRHHRASEDVARARNRGQARRHSPGGGLRSRERKALRPAQTEHDLLDGCLRSR